VRGVSAEEEIEGYAGIRKGLQKMQILSLRFQCFADNETENAAIVDLAVGELICYHGSMC